MYFLMNCQMPQQLDRSQVIALMSSIIFSQGRYDEEESVEKAATALITKLEPDVTVVAK